MNKNDRAILLGLTIGDGSIGVNKTGSPHPLGTCSLQIEHSEKQREYVEHKCNLLHSILGGKKPNIRENIHRVKGKEHKSFAFSKGHKVFRLVRRALYTNNRKVITRRVLDYLNPQAIALWYMDDGFYRRNGRKTGRQLVINTYVSFEENEIIRKYFEETHSISFRQQYHKREDKFVIECTRRENIDRFIKLVEPFIISSMRYKIDISLHPNFVPVNELPNLARGERNSQTKLTEAQVRAIRADKRPQPMIASDYGVSQASISDIKCFRTWKHIV